jgi:uncharacterized membrane protein YcaP (DUF421 family)
MSELMYKLFGEGKDLNALQMGDRAVVMFFITLILIRIAGRRAFGTKTAFDNIIVIMLGAILSRAVVGVSPFIPTVIASLAMVVVYRIFAYFSVTNETLSHLLKGKEMSLYKNGKINERNLKKCSISKGDLLEGVRLEGNVTALNEIEEAFMERNGQISVIKKEK